MDAAEIMLSLHGGDGAALVRLDSVRHVRFEGLTFELTRGDGIIVEDSRDVVIDRCVLRNIGGQGLVTEGCTRVGLLDSELYGIGSEAVRLSGGDRRTLTPGRNYVRNCRIRDFGRWKRTYSQAVRLHEGVGNEATHNLIHATPHIAIQYSGNEHLIQYNEIFDSCWETGDAGVIMGDWGWDSRGNRIVDNYLHDNVSRVPGRGGFNAVYLDGSCAGDTIAGNIFYDSGEFGVMHNSGREVVIDNNIFVGGKAAIHATVHAWYDTTEGHAMNFLERIRAFDYRKPPWSLAYPALAATPDDRGHPDFERFKLPVGSVLVRNLSWRSRYWLDPRRLEAYDHYERIAGNLDGEDPRFLDEAGRRLALRGDSPAWNIPGFRRIPFEKMGRLKRGKASRPHPPDGYDYPLPAGGQIVLRWAPALDGAARDLYLGEDPGSLEGKPAASRLENEEFVANLKPGKRYFWRVDERGAGGEVLARGDVWSFTAGLDSATAGAATWRFDTDSLTADLGGQLVRGEFEGGVAVYRFDDLQIPSGVTVAAAGKRPLELRSARDIAVRGTIDVSGEEGGDGLGGLARRRPRPAGRLRWRRGGSDRLHRQRGERAGGRECGNQHLLCRRRGRVRGPRRGRDDRAGTDREGRPYGHCERTSFRGRRVRSGRRRRPPVRGQRRRRRRRGNDCGSRRPGGRRRRGRRCGQVAGREKHTGHRIHPRRRGRRQRGPDRPAGGRRRRDRGRGPAQRPRREGGKLRLDGGQRGRRRGRQDRHCRQGPEDPRNSAPVRTGRGRFGAGGFRGPRGLLRGGRGQQRRCRRKRHRFLQGRRPKIKPNADTRAEKQTSPSLGRPPAAKLTVSTSRRQPRGFSTGCRASRVRTPDRRRAVLLRIDVTPAITTTEPPARS